MKSLAPPVKSQLLRAELQECEPLCHFRGLDVFALRGDEIPHTMREIARLREEAFRSAGAGRGQEIDTDALDTGVRSYVQLFAFDPEEVELPAMLRFQYGARALTHGDSVLRTASLFEYTATMRETVLPHCIELGRSVVNQRACRAQLGLFAVWRGLATLLNQDPSLRFFFGNVSLFPDYKPEARDRLLAWCETFYAGKEPLLCAREGLRYDPPLQARQWAEEQLMSWPSALDGSKQTRKRVKFIQQELHRAGESLPTMLQSYLNLGQGVLLGETVRDMDFGGALEIGLVVPLAAIERPTRLLFGIARDDIPAPDAGVGESPRR